MKTRIVLMTFLLAAVLACREKNQVDVLPPVVDSITMDGIAISEINLQSSQEFSLAISVSDNMGLNQLRVSIQSADSNQPILNVGEWTSQQTINISGKEYEKTFQFAVPDSIAGNWQIRVECMDALGQMASPATVALKVTNPLAPIVGGSTNPAADANNVVQLAAGANLFVSGTAVDPDNFQSIKVILANRNGSPLNTIDVPLLNSPIAFGPSSFDNASAGNYRVIIRVKDQLGYTSHWGTFVKVQ